MEDDTKKAGLVCSYKDCKNKSYSSANKFYRFPEVESWEFEIRNLQKFKELSSVRTNLKLLLADKKAILYAATLLEHDNFEVIELCLDIFENFLENEENHLTLLTTFGVYESLESLCIRVRNRNEKVFKRASDITEKLRNAAPPALNTRSRVKGGKWLKKPTVFLLYVPDLTVESRTKLESAIIKIKGVVSFLIDIEVKRFTLRICPRVTLKEVVEKIFRKCDLKCLIVKKNRKDGMEVTYYDVLTSTPNRSFLDYPDDEYCLEKSRMLTTADSCRKSGPGFFNSVRNFCKESFYW